MIKNCHSHFTYIICQFLEKSLLIMITMMRIPITYTTFVNHFVMDQILILIALMYQLISGSQQSNEKSILITFPVSPLSFPFKDEEATKRLRIFCASYTIWLEFFLLTAMIYCFSKAKYYQFIKSSCRCKRISK